MGATLGAVQPKMCQTPSNTVYVGSKRTKRATHHLSFATPSKQRGFDSNPGGFWSPDKRHPPTIGWQTPIATKECIDPDSLSWVCSRKNKSAKHPGDVLMEPCA